MTEVSQTLAEAQRGENSPVQANRGEDVRILDLVAVSIRNRMWILGGMFLGVLVAVLAAALWPERYAVRTVLLPSQAGAESRSQQLLSQLPPSLAALAGANRSDQAIVGVILESSTLADSMLARLEEQYGHPVAENEVREILDEQTDIKPGEGGSVVITVKGSNPVLTTRIASAYPELLNGIMSRLSAETAIRKQAFLETQLDIARAKLEGSEERLVRFQVSQDAPEVEAQARQTLEAAAQLQARIMDQEIEVAQLRRSSTPNNPELRAAIAGLNARRSQLRQLTGREQQGGNVFLSLRETPDLQVAATRILRDYKKDEQVYTSLTAALAEAQVDAKNDLPVVNVLDYADVPKGPVPPPVALLLVMGLLFGLVFGLAAAFGREYLRTARADPENERFFAEWDKARTSLLLPLRHRRAT